MTVHTQPCSELPLDVLLAGDETSEVYRVVSKHVGHCGTCQQRLTELAGDPTWWNEAQSRMLPTQQRLEAYNGLRFGAHDRLIVEDELIELQRLAQILFQL